MRVISFDGNVYTGKTTLIRFLSDNYGYVSVDEHSLFIDGVPQRSFYKSEYLNLQDRYLSVDTYRKSFLQTGVNLLDRSFVSVSAHVFALYELGLADIREAYFDLLKKKIEEIIFPNVFVWVRCGYNISRARCLSVNNRKETEDIYLSNKYFESIEKFNAKWALAVGGCVINTESNPTDLWCSSIHDKIFKNPGTNLNGKIVTLDNIRRCMNL
ncbi:MAG: deoxynucleoside kinase [Candidatus Moraniibacteriota bacterium]|nr:MAG: deoxynucleoside kinase [Candidatus Moranbacteria bacterium]